MQNAEKLTGVGTTTCRWDKFPQVSVKESPFHSGDTSKIARTLLREKVPGSNPGLTEMMGAMNDGLFSQVTA